ncbi:MAG: hypothetical protein MI864_16000 [Pseudomonadales bacterium]|nr:hypothetical protein [Pseudomonadales bacterium]
MASSKGLSFVKKLQKSEKTGGFAEKLAIKGSGNGSEANWVYKFSLDC